MQKHTEGSNLSYILPRNANQAILLAEYAKDFMANGTPSQAVYDRVKLFHNDAFLCGVSALAQHTNAPHVLRNEALSYVALLGEQKELRVKGFCKVFGSDKLCIAEKAIAANCSAVREWDSNGTVFGFRSGKDGHQAGEFGH